MSWIHYFFSALAFVLTKKKKEALAFESNVMRHNVHVSLDCLCIATNLYLEQCWYYNNFCHNLSCEELWVIKMWTHIHSQIFSPLTTYHIMSCDKSCMKYYNINIAIIFKVFLFIFGNRYTYNYKLLNNYFNF